MTAMRLRESAAYGLRLYAYLLGVTLLGGAALGLGLALAVPEAPSLVGTGGPDSTELAAGGVLGFLGVTVLAIGYLGTGYKLIADAVATGSELATASAEPTRATDSSTPGSTSDEAQAAGAAAGDGATAGGPEQAAPVDADPTASSAATEVRDTGPAGGAAEAAEEAEPAGRDEYGSRQTEGPPEPTPEEIAFGPSDDDPEPPVDDTDEPVDDTGSDSVRPAGRNASSDPLADPTDDG